MTQPTDPVYAQFGNYFISASYVKWIESAGAKVIPIPWDATQNTLSEIFKTINGLILPGGSLNLPGSKYEENSLYLYDLTIAANDAGDIFPLWGTCQGFEQLLIMTSGNSSILENFNSYGISLPLKFTAKAKDSLIFRELPQNLWGIYETEPVCENLHHLGISPESFLASNLSTFYDILSTNIDRDGKEFVSVIESLKYPIYGVQWHPERNQYEWTDKEPIDASLNAVDCVQHLADFFVEKCRQNKHIWKQVVYDNVHAYPITYTYNLNKGHHLEMYFWK